MKRACFTVYSQAIVPRQRSSRSCSVQRRIQGQNRRPRSPTAAAGSGSPPSRWFTPAHGPCLCPHSMIRPGGTSAECGAPRPSRSAFRRQRAAPESQGGRGVGGSSLVKNSWASTQTRWTSMSFVASSPKARAGSSPLLISRTSAVAPPWTSPSGAFLTDGRSRRVRLGHSGTAVAGAWPRGRPDLRVARQTVDGRGQTPRRGSGVPARAAFDEHLTHYIGSSRRHPRLGRRAPESLVVSARLAPHPRQRRHRRPFTLGGVIHNSRSFGFTGWIAGVAVFNPADPRGCFRAPTEKETKNP